MNKHKAAPMELTETAATGPEWERTRVAYTALTDAIAHLVSGRRVDAKLREKFGDVNRALDEMASAAHAYRDAMAAALTNSGSDGWVACEERMPEIDRMVLVVTDGGIEIHTAMCGKSGVTDNLRWWNSEGNILLCSPMVTHWRELPPPPAAVGAKGEK